MPQLALSRVLIARPDRATVRASVAPANAGANADAALAAAYSGTLDDMWAHIAREELPGFAGIHRDSTAGEDVVLLLADTSRAAEKAARVEAHLSPRHRDGLARHVSRVRRVEYDFDQLQRWRMAVVAGVTDEGLRGLDIDERANRVALGVRRGANRARIRQQLQATGVPLHAVTFFHDEGLVNPAIQQCPQAAQAVPRSSASPSIVTNPCNPPSDPSPPPSPTPTPPILDPVIPTPPVSVPSGSLLDRWDTPVGGVEIGYNIDPAHHNFCSLGVAADFLGVASYVTASHCAISPGVVDNAVLYQPSYGTEIGQKTFDPSYTGYYLGHPVGIPNPNPCFAGYQCRVADVAIYTSTAQDRTWRQGYAALTLLDLSDGDSQLTTVFNPYGIGFGATQTFLGVPACNASCYNPNTWDAAGVAGMRVYHVGRTTGTRDGTVVKTCYDSMDPNTHLAWVCQFSVQGLSGKFFDHGDSGSPVYTDHVSAYWLAGLVSFLRGTSEPDNYVYTPWGNVDLEIFQQYRLDGRTALRVTAQ